jgi:hypothetical protein
MAVLMVGCASPGGEVPTQRELSAYTDATPPMGKAVKFFMYTHCGVEHARIGGRWWTAQTPLTDATGVNAPTGWDNPYQEGRLTLESAERAVFVAHKTEVVLLPAGTSEPPPRCK